MDITTNRASSSNCVTHMKKPASVRHNTCLTKPLLQLPVSARTTPFSDYTRLNTEKMYDYVRTLILSKFENLKKDARKKGGGRASHHISVKFTHILFITNVR